VITVGNIIIANTIITASKLCPLGKLNTSCIVGIPSTIIHTPWAAADDIDTHGYPFPKAV
ncbi:MAG: hypothetical protein E7J15_01615, partial [Neisseria sp.]|nr:hypothetical protein [Neisseria sp.]